jgi:hypothetical protein
MMVTTAGSTSSATAAKASWRAFSAALWGFVCAQVAHGWRKKNKIPKLTTGIGNTPIPLL